MSEPVIFFHEDIAIVLQLPATVDYYAAFLSKRLETENILKQYSGNAEITAVFQKDQSDVDVKIEETESNIKLTNIHVYQRVNIITEDLSEMEEYLRNNPDRSGFVLDKGFFQHAMMFQGYIVYLKVLGKELKKHPKVFEKAIEVVDACLDHTRAVFDDINC